jgi:2'-5' RNA ligase
MTHAAGGARVRLFCALRLPPETVEAIAAWQSRELRGGRIVPEANLHLTLAFIGSVEVAAVEPVADALGAAAAAAGAICLPLRAYRETPSVGMLTCDDEGGEAAALAGRLRVSLAALGLDRGETRRFLPHLTVLRFATRPRLDPPLPELPALRPIDTAMFRSLLRPDGARYEVVEAKPLGG